MTSIGIQVHGGMGYVEETGAAQYFRDSRIAPIYEGTNGIQAIDLVLRKLPIDDGKVVEGMIEEMTHVLTRMNDHEELSAFRDELTTAIQALARTSTWMGSRLVEGAVDDALAGATPYLNQFGTVLGGWLMAVSAVAALEGAPDHDEEFLAQKVVTARFYGEHLLPKSNSFVPTIEAGSTLLAQASLS
jgi:butyryl-CoA dehydrogenase